MTVLPLRKHAEVLAELLPIAGQRILDVGCGGGALVRRFARDGAEAVGVDPLPQAIEKAEAGDPVPGASFRLAGGEDLPFADASFDSVCFFNSLHHVPQALMAGALREALRVVKSGGRIVVVEPIADGAFFELVRPVDDETEVRRQALEALEAFAAGPGVAAEPAQFYDAPYRHRDFAEMERSILAVDPGRAEPMARHRAAMAEQFESVAERDEKGNYLFRQPMRAQAVVKRA